MNGKGRKPKKKSWERLVTHLSLSTDSDGSCLKAEQQRPEDPEPWPLVPKAESDVRTVRAGVFHGVKGTREWGHIFGARIAKGTHGMQTFRDRGN